MKADLKEHIDIKETEKKRQRQKKRKEEQNKEREECLRRAGILVVGAGAGALLTNTSLPLTMIPPQ